MINHAALEYMEERALPKIVIDKFRVIEDSIFASREEWERYPARSPRATKDENTTTIDIVQFYGGYFHDSCLNGLGLSEMKVTPNPILIATEAAL